MVNPNMQQQSSTFPNHFESGKSKQETFTHGGARQNSFQRSPGCATTALCFAIALLLVPLVLKAPWWGWCLASAPAIFLGFMAVGLMLDGDTQPGLQNTRVSPDDEIELGPNLLEDGLGEDMTWIAKEDDTPLTRAAWQLLDKAAEKIVERLREPFAQASFQLGKAAYFEVMVLLMCHTSLSVFDMHYIEYSAGKAIDRLNVILDSYCRKQLQRMFHGISTDHENLESLLSERTMRYRLTFLNGRSRLSMMRLSDDVTDQVGQNLLGGGGGKALRQMIEAQRKLGTPESLLCKYLCGVGVRDAPSLLGSLHDFEPPPTYPQLAQAVAVVYKSIVERHDHYFFRLIGNDVAGALDMTEEQVQTRLHSIATEAQLRQGENRK